MLAELELKAVVPDPEALRVRLRSAGAIAGFRGRMTDRRYDRAGELAARDEVLRIRTYHHPQGFTESVLAWKGATGRSPEGYKLRQEIELAVQSEHGAAERLLAAMGYAPVHLIERDVEIYRVEEATVRLERYPEMDSLVEVEGSPEAIERAIEVTGIPRRTFTPEALNEFVRRYEARTGGRARLSAEGGAW
jgi:predicted adenylyl cyclase CyaB